MIHLSKTLMEGKALLLMKDRRLIAYHKGNLVVYKEDGKENAIVHLPMSTLKKFLCNWRILERALHTDVRWAREIDKNTVLFLFKKCIYTVNLENGLVKKDFSGFRGNPFSITQVDNEFYIGDYGGNNGRAPVNVYKRSEDGKWNVVYSFPEKSIRHIHNIINVDYGFYILTGDEDQESGIWWTDKAFARVKPVLLGSQQYRCCQLFKEKDNIYYLTDAPSEQNYLYKLKNSGTVKIDKIPGTCIYGTNAFGGLLFSTTVEPEAHAKNRIEYWLTRKPGYGINGKNAFIMFLKNGNISKIGCFEHDSKPLRLLQYATVYFSYGCESIIFCTPYSVKKEDNKIFKIEL